MFNVRQEFSKDLDAEIGNAWKVGLDVNSGQFSFNYDLPSFPYEPEKASIDYFAPAGYVEYRRRGKYADLITGIRSISTDCKMRTLKLRSILGSSLDFS